MSRYWAFWKRGWWAWFLLLFATGLFNVFLLPLGFAFRDNLFGYWIAVVLAWFVIGVPIWGWLFERFAAESPRLIPREPPPSDG